ncbi:NADPH2:quinone reductase [Actinocorallia herbida]|uniref:NADPH2:quinone reductase n=1 Tax=Actinocorallia herbida TaxID=58109 RepID=A0A3N1D2Y0_9ACTN|nr:NADPH:quinone oxidoreductase family protein [Actinocorallia herbida]ROO87836.1 NADPH2:quinone reductase [Actinocorallia herbida]
MKALVLQELVGPAGLHYVDTPEPTADDLVHIDVHVAGVNFPDLLLMKGMYQQKADPPFIPGSEVCGTVVRAPVGSAWSPGDRVSALTTVGGYAERVAVDPGLVVATPWQLTDAEATGLLINHQTAYFSLVIRGGLQAGETVVVLGAAGGIGSAAVQIAAALGARVIAVEKREGVEEFVRSLGAGDVVRAEDGWAAKVTELTGGAHLVIDPVGGPHLEEGLRSLRVGGRLVVVGFAAGAIPTIAANRLLLRNVSTIGAAWGAYFLATPGALATVAAALEALVEDGLRPVLTATYPLAEGRAAVELLEAGGVVGKIAIAVR